MSDETSAIAPEEQPSQVPEDLSATPAADAPAAKAKAKPKGPKLDQVKVEDGSVYLRFYCIVPVSKKPKDESEPAPDKFVWIPLSNVTFINSVKKGKLRAEGTNGVDAEGKPKRMSAFVSAETLQYLTTVLSDNGLPAPTIVIDESEPVPRVRNPQAGKKKRGLAKTADAQTTAAPEQPPAKRAITQLLSSGCPMKNTALDTLKIDQAGQIVYSAITAALHALNHM